MSDYITGNIHSLTTAKPKKTPKDPTKFVEKASEVDAERSTKYVDFFYKDMGKLISSKDDEQSAYAKERIFPNGVIQHYVKFGTAGAGIGRMFDPWGVYYNEGDETRYEKEMGRFRYEFSEVKKDVFDSYIKYLQTRNENYIRTAEREKNNGIS